MSPSAALCCAFQCLQRRDRIARHRIAWLQAMITSTGSPMREPSRNWRSSKPFALLHVDAAGFAALRHRRRGMRNGAVSPSGASAANTIAGGAGANGGSSVGNDTRTLTLWLAASATRTPRLRPAPPRARSAIALAPADRGGSHRPRSAAPPLRCATRGRIDAHQRRPGPRFPRFDVAARHAAVEWRAHQGVAAGLLRRPARDTGARHRARRRRHRVRPGLVELQLRHELPARQRGVAAIRLFRFRRGCLGRAQLRARRVRAGVPVLHRGDPQQHLAALDPVMLTSTSTAVTRLRSAPRDRRGATAPPPFVPAAAGPAVRGHDAGTCPRPPARGFGHIAAAAGGKRQRERHGQPCVFHLSAFPRECPVCAGRCPRTEAGDAGLEQVEADEAVSHSHSGEAKCAPARG